MRAGWIAISILAACSGSDPPIDVPSPDAASAVLAFDEGTAFDVALAGPGAVSVGDADADGNADLVFGFGTKVSVLLGDGAGDFAAQTPIVLDHNDVVDVALRGVTLSIAVRREFDSVVLDYPDIVYSDPRAIYAVAAGDDWLAVHHLDALAIVGGAEVALPGVETFAGLAIADFDGDGMLDLATGGAPGEIYTLRQTAPGVLAAPEIVPALSPITTFVFAGQFGGDAAAEVAALGIGRIRVVLDGAPVDTFIDLRGPIAVGDLNGDGLDDIAGFGDGGATILIADPNVPGSFVSAAELGQPGSDIAIADIDGDDRPDVVVVGPEQLFVYRQS